MSEQPRWTSMFTNKRKPVVLIFELYLEYFLIHPMMLVFDREVVLILDHVNVFLVQVHLLLVVQYSIHQVNFVFQYQIFLSEQRTSKMIENMIRKSYDEVHLMLLLNHDFHLLVVRIEMMFV